MQENRRKAISSSVINAKKVGLILGTLGRQGSSKILQVLLTLIIINIYYSRRLSYIKRLKVMRKFRFAIVRSDTIC